VLLDGFDNGPVSVGRGAWMVFGVFALLLVVMPTLLFMRRPPEEMGLLPDGGPVEPKAEVATPKKARHAKRTDADNVEWSRREVLLTTVFWLIASTFGVAPIGVTGLNLHVFSYVTDQGYPTLVAASEMSIIAIMQFGTPIVWGNLADRMDNGILNMAKCAFQGAGLSVALLLPGMVPMPVFLSTVSAWGSLVTRMFSAFGPPFFGLLFDYTDSYKLSFSIFIAMLFTSAVFSLCLRPPMKPA
jgi:cyanate permease